MVLELEKLKPAIREGDFLRPQRVGLLWWMCPLLWDQLPKTFRKRKDQ
jgi:hypothetical protein